MIPHPSRARRHAHIVLALATTIGMLAAACTPAKPPSTPASTPDTASSTARNVQAVLVPSGVSLSWEADDGVNDFTVAFRRSGTATWTTKAVTGRTTIVDGQTKYTNYDYRVRAAPSELVPNPGWSGTRVHRFYQLTLPVLSVDTNNVPITSKEVYVSGTVNIDPNGSGYSEFSGTTEIKGRGNSTWPLPKKPYRLKLSSKAPLMGMPANKHWVLLANYMDRSMIRTTTAQNLAALTSLAWTPQSRMVELVLNGMYMGPYQLIEQVRIDPNRVNIDEMEPTDISGESVTGGYLLEVDFRFDEQPFRTTHGAQISVKEPEDYQPEQEAYIEYVLQRFDDALFAPNFTDPVNGYRAYVDIDSLVDTYLISEFTMQLDAFYSSTYFYKKRTDEKLYFGPMWDFDLSIAANNDYLTNPHSSTMYWVNNDLISSNRGGAGVWVRRLFKDPTFESAVHDRWQELKDPFRAVIEQMDELQAPLMPAIGADTNRWGRPAFGGYNTALYMQNWMRSRWAWMNAVM